MDSYLERLRRNSKTQWGTLPPLSWARVRQGSGRPAQVLEHLYLTYRQTNKGLAKCIEAGRALATKPKLRDSVRSFVVLDLNYFPTGRNAPERAMPKGMAADQVGGAILSEIKQMEIAFAECESKFGSKTKLMDHPVLGPLNPRQWRKFHWVHGRHHAQQVRERLGKR